METKEIKSKFKKYPEYKDSGIEWLGKIPKEWEIKRLKFLAKFKKGQLPKNIISENTGSLPAYMSMDYLRNGDCKEWVTDYNCITIDEGEILLLWDGSNAGEFILSKKGVISSTIAIVNFNKVNKRFAWYYSKRLEIEIKKNTIGMGIPHVNGKFLNNLSFLIPSNSEQTAIANFLDEKTKKIDQVISAKEKLISLLQERKQIVIQNAVTRGLNPNVKLKDSGVEWIGMIPEHWEVKKLKYIGKSIIGLTYSPNDLCNINEGTLVLRSSNLYEGKFKYGEKENIYVKKNIQPKLILKENDILICSRNGSRDLIGKCAIATKKDIGVSFGAFTTVFRSSINKYIFLILNSEIFKFLSGLFLTSTINQLTIGNLNSIAVPIPPTDERYDIYVYIKKTTNKIDHSISNQRTLITKLKEYKQTLIDSAVTGKIKII